MAKLVMMCGVPGSGKSFFSGTLKKRAKKHVYIISSDRIRKMVLGSPQNFTNEKLCWSLFYDLAKVYAQDKDGIVILDATQLTTYYRTVSTKDLKELYDERILLVFKIDKDIVFHQNQHRRYPVPVDALERMINEYEEPNDQDRAYFTEIIEIKDKNIIPIINRILKK